VTRAPVISCALIIGIAACSGRDPVDDKAKGAAGLPDVNVSAPSAMGEPHAATAPAQALPAPAVAIPAALQGRWGLAPADCTAALSNAKGLLIVSSSELRFYESRAVPTSDAQSDTYSVSGTFAFTGEGQSWTKYEALKVDKGRLTRTETKPSASFSYAKCS
jgi:hypothetical protein